MIEQFPNLHPERRGGVLLLTIDSPPMNAITPAVHAELARVFQEVNHDDATKVVVITGAGQRAFSAGGDLGAMLDRLENHRHSEWVEAMSEARDLILGLVRLQKPLIARINGHAIGLGATIAAFADFSYMMADAKIADTHVNVGLAAGDGGAAIWPLLVGFTRARQHLLTGDPLTGRQAAEIGLVTQAVESFEELDARVWQLAQRLETGSTLAVRYTKMAINLVLEKLLDGVVDTHLGWETLTYMSPDHKEAVKAILEKRAPVFS